jgi:tetratricopeptide (TPR) repeat protein
VTAHLTQARLDELWDFDNPAESEKRFRAELLLADPRSAIAGELATQLARARGLQSDFAEAEQILSGIASSDPAVLVRVLLERGRVLNSSGRAREAVPLFEEALLIAAAEGDDFLTVDAAHMLAIADPARSAAWTARALETVDETEDPRTKQWSVGLHNNRGWALAASGDLAAALVEFELAADSARDFGTAQQRVWAQEAIDEIRDRISQLADQ